ncbi:hypothetical protein [Nostoc sp.]|uniref:hypothetical protein n=1 Tax=Nostoc sp. TaxID=1180 RepID=UPI002FF5464E
MRISDRTHTYLSKKSDRLYKVYCKEAMSTTGYANAPHLSLIEGAIACMKVIAKKRSH